MFARLYQMPSPVARQRAGELLSSSTSSRPATGVVKTYSGACGAGSTWQAP